MPILVTYGGHRHYAVDVYVSGFLPEYEQHGVFRVLELHTPDGGFWNRVYTIGHTPPDNLQVFHPSAGADEVQFFAYWDLPGYAVYADYQLGTWYDWSSGSAVSVISESSYYVSADSEARTLNVTSFPGQQHRLSFTVRAKESNGQPASAYVESAVFTWTDPRNAV